MVNFQSWIITTQDIKAHSTIPLPGYIVKEVHINEHKFTFKLSQAKKVMYFSLKEKIQMKRWVQIVIFVSLIYLNQLSGVNQVFFKHFILISWKVCLNLYCFKTNIFLYLQYFYILHANQLEIFLLMF